MRILFCTGNDGKFQEAVLALDGLSGGGVTAGRVTVTRCDADPDELQGDADAIARAKTVAALAVLRQSGHPLEGAFDFLVTEDVSFHLSCLNGFPGPYVKDFLDAVNEEGLWDLARRYDDRGASAVCRVAVADLRGRDAASASAAAATPPPVLLFRGELAGTVVAPRGDVRHGKRSWNACFVPAGHERTFGEMSFLEQSGMSHRNAALAAFMAACGPAAPSPSGADVGAAKTA